MDSSSVSKKRLAARPWLWLVLLLLVAVAAVVAFMKFGQAQQQEERGGRRGFDPNRPTPVLVATAQTRDVNVYLNGLGSITPLNSVIVRTQVDGQLMRIAFKEGQTVRAGDLLAEIDPRPLQAQLAQYEGQLARDEALLKNAEVDLERYRTLLGQDSIAKQQVDTQEALVRQYQGTVKADQGQIQATRVQLAYTRITAPITGRVGLKQVDAGNLVQTSDTNGIVVITQLQPITAVFSLPEDNLPGIMKRLQSGEKLPVEAFNRERSAQLASGSLLTVDNQIDATTGTIKLKAQFPNQDNALFANQFVNIRMLIDVKQGATVVPTAAVQRGSQGTYVYVVADDQTVSVRPVKTGAVEADVVAIENGIKPGEKVVVDGTDKLREGAKVQVASRDAAGGPATAPAAPAAPASGQERPNRRRRQQD